MRARIWTAALATPLLLVSAGAAPEASCCREQIAIEDFRSFERTIRPDGSVELVSPWWSPSVRWDELVGSWNAELPPGAELEVRVRVQHPDPPSTCFSLGRWSPDDGPSGRRSISHQRDPLGRVDTDTLVLRQPTRDFQVHVRISLRESVGPARLRFLALSLSNAGATNVADLTDCRAWGRRLADVPVRSQLNYPGGNAWCSPTSLSMILGYWAARLGRADLDLEVPEVARGVDDPAWPGTGNWSFNMAYAGARPGLRAFVARLDGLAELEQWIDRGVPIAVSVAYSILKGRAREPDDGHLIVVVGFDANGDPQVHDPGSRQQPQRTFARDRFAAAWALTRHTAYVVHPEDWGPFRRATVTH